MSESFEDVWRRATLELPVVPPLLIRAWTQEAYAKACEGWGWGFLRAEGALVTLAARDVTVGVVLGSATVTSAASFVSTDVGRQLRLGSSIPVYTIIAFTNTSSITLDQPYSRDTAASTTAQILDAYTTLPADFKRFLIVLDTYNQRAIPFWYTADQLAVTDPTRRSSDTGPRALVARKYSPVAATLGQTQYEYWPYPTAAKSYPYLYIRKAGALTDTDPLPGMFAERSDVLRLYVLAKGAMWAGTSDLKNPSFNLAAAQSYKAEWEVEIQRLTLSDDNEYPQQYMPVHWDRREGQLTGPASYLRQTDATIEDYF